jgi:hypothetical protein
MNEDKRTNNDLQNTTQKKLKIEQHGPSKKREGTQVLWKGETVVLILYPELPFNPWKIHI